MEERKLTDDITVNDGKGLYDSAGLIDTLIMDCNILPKLLYNGEFVGHCAKIVEMVQKLSKLKTGIQEEQISMRKQINEMTKTNNELVSELFELKTGNGVEGNGESDGIPV